VGRFQIRELLGTGAFGAVYRAYDPKLDREVALKVPQADVLEKKQLERFLPEARAAARLRHPNIVPVFEIGQDSGRYYIVTAYIPGQSLEDAIEGKGLELSRVVRIVRALAEAVVPEGRLKLAQRFIVGQERPKNLL
jgi:serine/threonine protein kinase